MRLEPVGFVRTAAADDVVKHEWQELRSAIEVVPEYGAALSGIDGFSHLIVLYFMDRLPEATRKTLQVKPRGLLRFGLSLDELPTIGVFACDSPVRPNPIGVSIVELLERQGATLSVKGLDAFDGTPVLDIKPYTPDRRVADIRVPDWHHGLLEKTAAPRV